MSHSKIYSIKRKLFYSFICRITFLFLLFFIHITQGQAELSFNAVIKAIFLPNNSNADNIVRYLRLPRATITVIVGAALGIAGALLETVTRNPLASAATFGVNAGALSNSNSYGDFCCQSLFTPFVTRIGSICRWVASGFFSICHCCCWGDNADSANCLGVAVSLTLASLTAALQLFLQNETRDLFFWGAELLVQTNWDSTIYAAPRILNWNDNCNYYGKAVRCFVIGR